MANLLKLEDVLDILVDPYTKDPLSFKGNIFTNLCNNDQFPVVNSACSPLFFPNEILPYCNQDSLNWTDLIKSKTALKQYFGISYIKWSGASHNSMPDDEHYKTYLENFKKLIAEATGRVLDIGCDDPQNTIKYFPEGVNYLGLDPLYYIPSSQFKVFAISEFLPFKSGSFDSVCFGTSLDHAFDEYAALSEAARVLVPNGNLYLSTLVWEKSAELHRDSVHFHHFRESHINQMLEEQGFETKSTFTSFWKNDSHRKVLFLNAVKK